MVTFCFSWGQHEDGGQETRRWTQIQGNRAVIWDNCSPLQSQPTQALQLILLGLLPPMPGLPGVLLWLPPQPPGSQELPDQRILLQQPAPLFFTQQK